MARVSDKVAVVTGAGAGIGAESARLLAAEGARVVVADVVREAAEKVAAQIGEAGGTAIAAVFDLGDEASIEALTAAAVREFGGIDILFNNAAPTHLGGPADKPIADADAALWDDSLRINVRGTMLVTKYTVPHMIDRGGGSIVNAASGAGLAGDLGHPAYGAAKAAVVRLTTYTATEFGRQGVRCNAIAPGLIVTERMGSTFDAGPMREVMLRQVLGTRLGRPADIANAVLFLASDESQYINGQTICVDGGLFAHMPYWADMVELTSARAGGAS